MRLIIAGLTLALAASAPLAASTQAPVTMPPLAPGEVLVEVNALGMVTTRADRATLMLTVSGNGETEAQARAEALKSSLVDGGVPAARIQAAGRKSAATAKKAAEVIVAP